MKEEQKRLPVYLLTGFLGSGKTTLLQKLLAWSSQQQLKVGLVINDFGAVNVDSLMIAANPGANREGVTLKELSGGCACCTVSRNLVVDLLEMAISYDLDMIIIEASGIADPLDLLDQITTPGLLRRMYPAGLISVVDGPRFRDMVNSMALVRRQAQFADVIILNKCDLINPTEYKQTRATLQELNPHAHLEATIFAEIDPTLVFTANQSRLLNTPHRHDDHSHLPFHTFEFYLEKPLIKERFKEFINQLPANVLRAKGFLHFAGEVAPALFQYTPGTKNLTPLDPDDALTTALVFIGLEMDKTALEAGLQACAAE